MLSEDLSSCLATAKADQLMPMLETVAIDEVIEVAQLDLQKALAKKSVRQIAGAARNFAGGLRQRMNAIAEGDATRPDTSKGQESEAAASLPSAQAEAPSDDGEAASVATGTATDAPADGAAANKPTRTKQKGRVLTSTALAEPTFRRGENRLSKSSSGFVPMAANQRRDHLDVFPAMSLIVIVLIAVLSCQSAAAQTAPSGDQRIVHESWTFKDGAPEGPTAFAQTADGCLWVGAPEGFFRFDGMRFELFRSPFGDPLQSTNVSALFAVDDRLWVGYVFGGFSYLKNGRVKNFVEATGTVTGFAKDTRGITWAGASGAAGQSGLWRFDGSSWQQIGADWNAPVRGVAQLGFDRDGIRWILSGRRAREAPKQLYFLAPGERPFRKAGDNLFVSSFTWDADNHIVSTRERGRNESGASI